MENSVPVKAACGASLRVHLASAKVTPLLVDPMRKCFRKNMYGSEWRETDNYLIPHELGHELHICQFKR